MNFHTIPTHVRPDFDEILGIALARGCGEELFPGVSNAKIEYWPTGETPDGRPFAEWMARGYFPSIGIAGSVCDEHASPSQAKAEGECSATLTAELLGVRGHPVLASILRVAQVSDTKASTGPFTIPGIVQSLHRLFPNDPDRVMRWTVGGIRAKWVAEERRISSTQVEVAGGTPHAERVPFLDLVSRWIMAKFGNGAPVPVKVNPLAVLRILRLEDDEGLRPIARLVENFKVGTSLHPFSIEAITPLFYDIYSASLVEEWVADALEARWNDQRLFLEARAEFNARAMKTMIFPDGENGVRVAFVDSDNERMNKASRSTGCGGCELLIQKGSRGNIQVFVDSQSRLDLRYIVGALRHEEQILAGQMVCTDPDVLECEGKVAGIPEWYYQRFSQGGQLILNGSPKYPAVPPTRISPQTIRRIVRDRLAFQTG